MTQPDFESIHMGGWIFDCRRCPSPCDSRSKLHYLFEEDLGRSAVFERELIELINGREGFYAELSSHTAWPDITVFQKQNKEVALFIELKYQQRTFMKVEQRLPGSGLVPSETVALNTSDLLRYHQLTNELRAPVFIFWAIENRPCIIAAGEHRFFYASLKKLIRIYRAEKSTRSFNRRTGKGDIQQGEHKGVTHNFHFRLSELKPFNISNDRSFGI